MPNNTQDKHDTLQAWQGIVAALDADTRALVGHKVQQLAATLADRFYTAMMAHAQAGKLLDHTVVNQRLNASMQRWLRQLFDPAAPLADILDMQRRTGEVHARIGVPVAMVAEGARVLKRGILQALASDGLEPERLAGTVQYVYELTDIAIDTMNMAYNANSLRLTRSDDAYRLFFLTQNLQAERERQRSQLLEWAHQILVTNYWELQPGKEASTPIVPGSSQFSLWLQHKAGLLFDKSPELADIRDRMNHIECQLLPQLRLARSNEQDARSTVTTINTEIDRIKHLLGAMFERVTAVEDGRDSVTHLLNRRYFPTVAKREIGLVQSGHSTFALAMIDIDHFTVVGQTLGMAAADTVLLQVANALADAVRAGDFVFRIGDDQFLVLLVEAPEPTAAAVANGLRERIARLSLRTPLGAATGVTVSIGLAVYDGHPDYQNLLDRADAALRKAKLDGRNRVEVAAALN